VEPLHGLAARLLGADLARRQRVAARLTARLTGWRWHEGPDRVLAVLAVLAGGQRGQRERPPLRHAGAPDVATD
jgi:hypothetical protein